MLRLLVASLLRCFVASLSRCFVASLPRRFFVERPPVVESKACSRMRSRHWTRSHDGSHGSSLFESSSLNWDLIAEEASSPIETSPLNEASPPDRGLISEWCFVTIKGHVAERGLSNVVLFRLWCPPHNVDRKVLKITLSQYLAIPTLALVSNTLIPLSIRLQSWEVRCGGNLCCL